MGESTAGVNLKSSIIILWAMCFENMKHESHLMLFDTDTILVNFILRWCKVGISLYFMLLFIGILL